MPKEREKSYTDYEVLYHSLLNNDDNVLRWYGRQCALPFKGITSFVFRNNSLNLHKTYQVGKNFHLSQMEPVMKKMASWL